MAIQNSKTLKSGVSGNYWKITKLNIDLVALVTTIEISLYLDSTHGNDGVSGPIFKKTYITSVTLQQIMQGSITNLYNNILAKANSLVPNVGSDGTHIFDTDLAGGTIVS